jgi:phage major head subunit gpT-like protein
MTQHDPPAVFAADAPSVDLPMQTRLEVRLMPDTVALEARTIEVVWSTGAAVRRRDPWSGKAFEEVLSLDPAHVDLTRLNGGAPLLNAHGAFDLDDVIGVVERAWIAREGGTYVGRATVRFSDRADVEPIWQDVKGGIIRNVSVGYRVQAYEIREEEGAVPIWTAVDWQPLELSAVPVGADGAAGFRSNIATTTCRLLRQEKPLNPTHEEEIRMTDTTVESASEAQNEPISQDANAIATVADVERQEQHQMPASSSEKMRSESHSEMKPARILAEERARVTGIYDAARKLGVDQTLADDLVKRGVVIGDARAALIDAAAARDAAIQTRPHIRMGGLDEVETRRAAVEAALLHRFEPSRFKLTDAAREWRGLSLIEMARSFLEAEGVRVKGLARDEIATRALHSTSDFPQILAGVTNRTLRDAYEAAPRTYQPISRRASVADFKSVQRLQLGEAPQLEKVNESGEFKRGTIGEAKETYRVEPYGKVVGITRQVLINDDLDAFTRVPSLFGTSAATLESDVVWNILTANANMADGKTLFHAGHNNLAGTGTALDVTNLAKARTAMSRQTGLDGKTVLNIRPAFLVVPTSLELAAEQLLAQNLVPAKSGDVVPTSIRSLSIISEPRLDPASGAVPWYLVASPAAIDTIEYAFLEGQEGVFIETRMGFDVDGVEIKARLDFGAKAIDWRGLYKNPGVALT